MIREMASRRGGLTQMAREFGIARSTVRDRAVWLGARVPVKEDARVPVRSTPAGVDDVAGFAATMRQIDARKEAAPSTRDTRRSWRGTLGVEVLPAGHPITWGAITEGTCLAGSAYG